MRPFSEWRDNLRFTLLIVATAFALVGTASAATTQPFLTENQTDKASGHQTLTHKTAI